MSVSNPRLALLVSYSGSRSQLLAKALVELVRILLPKVDPWFYGPEGGTRHLVDLASALDEVSFGISCLTPENLHSRWIHFEAGALSKLRGRLIPFLLDIETEDLELPLSQFGARVASMEGVQELMQDLAEAFGQTLPADSTAAIESHWQAVTLSLRAATRSQATAVDGNSPIHVRLLRMCRTIQRQTTPLRGFLAHRILTQAEAAIKEIADRQAPNLTPEDYVKLALAELGDAFRAFALCGGKPWGPGCRAKYYNACYDMARREAGRAPSGEAMIRYFVPPPRGQTWSLADFDVLMQHHSLTEQGVRARVLLGDGDAAWAGFSAIREDIGERGVGFMLIETRNRPAVVFAHRGGFDAPDGTHQTEPFRSGIFRNDYAIRECYRLLEGLAEHSKEFEPKDYPVELARWNTDKSGAR